MTKEEYLERKNKEEDWAPGWDAIEKEFDRLYPGMNPDHFATNFEARAMFGGNNYLDGYSIYTNDKGYKHIVTFGMSELYVDEEAFGGEYSKWGYEMTVKIKAEKSQDCMWVLDMLSNIARYTFESKKYFEAGQAMPGDGKSIHTGTDSKITALMVVNDTTAQTQNTVHGKVEFLQFVGLTTNEMNAIREDYSNFEIILNKMKVDNPELVLDMDRTEEYI